MPPVFVMAVFVLGGVIAILNFHLSFLRYPIHRLRGRAAEEYRWESGIPVFGSALLWVSLPFLTAHPSWMWGGVILSVLDTGGLHWFAAVMLWQEFLQPRYGKER